MTAIAAQAWRFLGVGVSLLVLDSGLYVAAVLSGLPIGVANPLSRAIAAVAGYFAHRHLTFAGPRRAGEPVQPLRYVLVWVALTLISTQSLVAIAAHANSVTAMTAKPLVEAVLALISFFLLKLWVYRQ